MTLAPALAASWTAIEPTPPAAPATTSVSSGPAWAAGTAAGAVVPATNSAPAASHGTPAGRGTRSPASTRTNSAWLARLSVNPLTPSPTATSPPVPATPPARSLPWPEGNVDGHRSARAPARIFASPGLIPAALTLTRTCPRPGAGRSTPATRSTSVPPYWSYLTALGIAEPPSQVLCVGEEPRPALVYARTTGHSPPGQRTKGPVPCAQGGPGCRCRACDDAKETP